jgi:hypothetical protein
MENSIDYLNKNLVLIQVSVGITQLPICSDKVSLLEQFLLQVIDS